MCTSPITQSDPIEGNKTFACRRCAKCIEARLNDWVVRCVAEMATSGETLPIELTYRNNEDGTLPDSAKAFRYADVRAFMNRLREEYYRTYKARGEIRFIVAGERGAEKDRVHWHMVIFSEKPITTLGKWSDFYFKPIEKPRIKRMDHWSFWDHGHVMTKEANQEGIQYCLKYALKDQFNVVNAEGHARETKALTHASSYFRMSKHPPMGFRFLERHCDELEEMLAVPTTLQIKPPGYNGFWWVKGDLREYFLERLYQINEKRKELHGRDAPQWNSLISSFVDENKDWEALVYGPETEQDVEHFDTNTWQQYLSTEQDAREKRAAKQKINKNCGGVRVCRLCWRGKNQEAKQRYHLWYSQQLKSFGPTAYYEQSDIDEWYRAKGQINPHCIPGEHEREIEDYRTGKTPNKGAGKGTS